MPNQLLHLNHPGGGLRRVLPVLMLLAGTTSGLGAATFTSISSACNNGTQILNSPSAASTQASNPTCHNGVEASGFAGPTGIGGYAELDANAFAGQGVGGSHRGDIFFFTTFRNASGTPGFTDVALNLTQSNVFDDPYTGFGKGASVGITIETFLYNVQTSTFRRGNGATSAVGITQVELGATNQALTTSFVNVPLNTDIGIWFRLTVDAGAGVEDEQLFINALNTLTLAKFGPVFQLGDGISVDDVPEIYLFNNRFTPPTSTEGVPEPGTWLMMAGGLGCLTLLRRRK